MLDLVDVLPITRLSHSGFREIVGSRKLDTAHDTGRLHGSVFCAHGSPSGPETVLRLTSFAEGRRRLVDPDSPVWHLSGKTLGYYSRFFFDPPTGFHRVMESVEIAEPYRDFASEVAHLLGDFGAIHVRLTDFRKFRPRRENDYRAEILRSVRSVFDPADLLVISTDESDNRAFFSDLLATFPRHIFLDEYIAREHAPDFRRLPFIDETAFGLVCNLVLRHSRQFAGTPGSSFTGMVHRARLRRAASENGCVRLADDTATFRFVSSGFDDRPVPFADAAYVETREGPYSWNRIELPLASGAKSWYREWPEAVVPVM